MKRRAATAAVLFTMIASVLGAITVEAPVAHALPTPGVNCQVAGTPVPGARYFPEAQETNDFIGYFEAKQCLANLKSAYPDRMNIRTVGKSYGWINTATQQREPNDVMLVEVTNFKSAIPFDDKVKILLMLSIHGNEKGGREGGLRVIEDFVRNIGIATQPATGHDGMTLYNLMDYAVFLMIFPNPDGWTQDEPQYLNPAQGCGTMYCRGNARGTDLNRQMPTPGWMLINPNAGRRPMFEPEGRGYVPVLMNYTNIAYAADIHGMLNPADGCAYGVCGFTDDAAPTGENVYGHFVLGLISAGQLTPKETLRSTRLANLLLDRLNKDPVFAGWNTLPSTSVWGGEYYSWSTVWDTIGYTDSGINGDFFLSRSGLRAPGMDFEMAYNHITFDSAYPGAAQAMNVYHLETVRQIARAYLEAAVTDVQTAIEAHGKSTGYLYNPKVFSSATDKPLDGWALDNPDDDLWDYAHVPYQAAPVDYFRELKPFMANKDLPAVFDEVKGSDLTLERLQHYDNFVIAGSAVAQVNQSQSAIAALKSYVQGGGNLVVTDDSLQLLELLGVTPPGSVKEVNRYAGMTLLQDRAHPFAKYSVKLSRQTYEPVPLGFPVGGQAPNWYVDAGALKAAGGEAVGVVPLQGSTSANIGGVVPNSVNCEGGGGGGPTQNAACTFNPNLGRVKVGSGYVSFLGSMLPDPTQDYYHPYGIVSYATTYFGNLLFYNMIGAEQVFSQPPIVLENVGQLRQAAGTPTLAAPASSGADLGQKGGTPGFEIGVLLVAVGAVVLVGVRRRRA